jgi:tRNA nucleotidyltransferase (CCA-adding enzyme)
LARFAARFADFSVAPETLALMRDMVADGEVDALVPERVWQELARGLMMDKPSRMFEVLRECGALARVLPEVARLWGVPQRADYHPEVDTGVHLMMVLDMSAQLEGSAGRALRLPDARPGQGHHAGRHPAAPHRPRRAQRAPAQGRVRTPARAERLPRDRRRGGARARQHPPQRRASAPRPWCGCWSAAMPSASRSASPVLLACECDARGRLGLHDSPYPQRARLLQALAAAQAVQTQPLAAEAQAAGKDGKQIGEAIHKARVKAVQAGLPGTDTGQPPPDQG